MRARILATDAGQFWGRGCRVFFGLRMQGDSEPRMQGIFWATDEHGFSRMELVCCLLSVVCCLLSVVCCLLCVVCCLLWVVCRAMAPLAPGRGEGPGVRGEDPLVRVCRSSGFSPSSAWRGWFSGVFF